jgi:uncharacterized protein (DUF1015 family)
MALLHAFRGYRYNREVVGDLNSVVAQPYDKISEALQRDYYERSPHNVVRITRNLEKNSNPETDYPDAGATLNRWLGERVLVRDSAPSYYACYEEYEFEGESKVQKGLIALLDLRDSAKRILPHERTLTEPKMDRLRLMRRTECNEDCIFMLYRDQEHEVNRLLDRATSARPPEIEVRDDFGAVHKLWALSDPAVTGSIGTLMSAQELFIADGHHRYETALNFMHESDSRGWRAAAVESFDKRMVTCFNSADKGISILPTHRLIRDLPQFDGGSFTRAAAQLFDVERVGSAAELWSALKDRRERHAFGFYAREVGLHLLQLKDEAQSDPALRSLPEASRALDVRILHTLVLDRLLGIDEAKLQAQAHVDYARDRQACLRRVDEGKYQAAFFLNPTTVEQMERVALIGEKMPQKSTDFYPKLLTGLVMMKMQIRK